MVKASRRSTHKTPHKSSTKPSPDTGWSSSFDHVSPYANGANDSDTEFEPYDVYYGLDISKRHDQAQFTKTPFTITQSQASSRSKSSKAAREAQELATGTASRNPSSSSSGKTMVEPKKTLEERIAEQEAADRKGGRSMTPSIEPPKAKKEDKGNSWSYKSNSGWKNAHGQPVAATKPPNPSKVINALNKIDKKASKAAKKRKAPDPAPASATVSAKTTAPAPPPALKAPPKSIREQLDDIERETKIKTKTTLSSAERKKVPAQDVHRPIAGRGKGREKKTVINKDDDISFKMLPAGAAPNDHFPIVKGLEKMKSLPQKKKPAPHHSSSSSSSDIHVPTIDLDEMLAEADAKSEEWRPSNRASRDAPTRKDVSPEEKTRMDEGSDSESKPNTQARRKKTTSIYFDEPMDMDVDMDISDQPKPPSLDQSSPTEITDTYLTPHGTDRHEDDYGSIGNPSTITHLSETIPHYTDPISSSSQVPYSSPALERARRAAPDRATLISPRPVRAVTGDVLKLERIARDQNHGGMINSGRLVGRENNQEDKAGGTGAVIKMERQRLDERDGKAAGKTDIGQLAGVAAETRGVAGHLRDARTVNRGDHVTANVSRSIRPGFRPPLPMIRNDRLDRLHEYGEEDIKPVETKWVEEEWSTLYRNRSKFAKSGQAGPGRSQQYLPPMTPNYKVPLFRQQQGTVAPSPNTGIGSGSGSSSSGSKFVFRPPPSRESSDESGRDGYKLKVVPNGTRAIPSYPMVEMSWTGAEMKRASAWAKEDQRPQDKWTKETQREMEIKIGGGGVGNGRDGQGGEQEEGDWREAWKAQSKRQVEENPHKQYAFDPRRLSGVGRGVVRGGRAFAL